jgi:hypothetical protein
LPSAKGIYAYAFGGCTALASVNLPYVTSVVSYAFNGCTSLTSIDLPSATSISDNAFNGCTSLAKADIHQNVSIGESAFLNCTSLSALILRYNGVCYINLFALEGTPALEGKAYIYVPSVVYENYRTVYEAQINQLMPGFFDILFRKIEDYPEICGAN